MRERKHKSKHIVLFISNDFYEVISDHSKVLSYLRELIFALIQLVPIGKVTTYSSIAKVLGVSPRFVANVLKSNEKPIVVPCHRVIKSNMELGGYTLHSRSSPEFKEKLLTLEGVKITKLGSRRVISEVHVINLEDVLLH